MPFYRKKPLVIEAYQLHALDCEDCPEWLKDLYDNPNECQIFENYIMIKTLEGWGQANLGDWIIKGVKGEFYSCRQDIFEITYEKLGEKPNDDRTNVPIQSL